MSDFGQNIFLHQLVSNNKVKHLFCLFAALLVTGSTLPPKGNLSLILFKNKWALELGTISLGVTKFSGSAIYCTIRYGKRPITRYLTETDSPSFSPPSRAQTRAAM